MKLISLLKRPSEITSGRGLMQSKMIQRKRGVINELSSRKANATTNVKTIKHI
jgi:hypothetical protein